MSYFKQGGELDQYLDNLLEWAENLERMVEETRLSGTKVGEDKKEIELIEESEVRQDLEELIEEIKHCQVAIGYSLHPGYILTLYDRANQLYQQLAPALDEDGFSSEDLIDSERAEDEHTAGETEDDQTAKEGEAVVPGQREGTERTSGRLQMKADNKHAKNPQDSAVKDQPVPIGGHRLPPLPYAYNALEPYISEEIMRLHHQKHHQSYVDGLNKAELNMAEARRTSRFDLLRHWEREAAFNGSGHYLHTIFWNNMSPDGGGEPKGEIARQIKQDFGSYKQFKQHFSEAAKQAEGVGWTLLVWSPRSHRLAILVAEKHQHFAQWDVIPLLVLDVWEHAYYLQYKNERADYIKEWWNVVNWDDVEDRFKKARQLRWTPY